jgi:hypothetical protein
MEPAARGLSSLRQDMTSPLVILLVMVGLLLLIACANIASLLLARSSARAREMALRLSIGAGRLRLVRQLLAESLLLALCGGALGLLFAGWGGRCAVRTAPGTAQYAGEPLGYTASTGARQRWRSADHAYRLAVW